MTKKDDFILAWNTSSSIDEFIEKYPHKIKRESASAQASNYRRDGAPLKHYSATAPGGRAPRQYADDVLDVAKKARHLGMSYSEIALLMGATKQAVHALLKKRRP